MELSKNYVNETFIIFAIKEKEYGLPWEEAINCLSLYPAQIFGVEDKLGSLEKGKIADIVIFGENPLKRHSSVKMVIINGEIVESFF